MKYVVLASLFFASSFAFARGVPRVDDVVDKSLAYLTAQQFSQNQGIYTAGEWPANMKSYFIPALLGVGKLFALPTDEPTSFASSSVINLLAEAYLTKPSLQKIPSMIDLGLGSLTDYQADGVFSYYKTELFRGVKVRAPLAKGYVPDYIRGLTNIPTDADTTSATYMALAYANQIHSGQSLAKYKIPQKALDAFTTFRDLNRTPHYYNWLEGVKRSGGFLTWFQNDRDPNMPRGVFAKPDKGTRIPFGFNDVDCVVNANVLRLLTATGSTDHPGYKDSCRLLNNMIIKNKQRQCGIYYPNAYAVFFSTSNVYKAGAPCLEESRDEAIRYLVQTQKEDGSWENEPGIGRTDKIQSTALAMNALMNYTEKNTPQYRSAIRSGAYFLMYNRKKTGDDQIYWKGEVFFSAVAQARNTVLWRSDAYTTSLAALALVKAQDYLGGDL